MSDDDLVARCRLGDAEAWSEVLERYQRLVRSIPRVYGLGHHDIEDVTQRTFGVLVQSLDRLQPDTRLAPWLSIVARRHTWRLVEARRRENNSDAHLDGTHDDVRAHEQLYADTEWVQEGLRQLAPRCRSLLEALYLRGETAYAEIASELGIPIGSIGPTRARCLDKLRQILTRTAAVGSTDGKWHDIER